LLNRGNVDWFVHAKSSRILATLMCGSQDLSVETIKTVCQWINERVRKGDDQDVAIGLTALQKLLRRNEIRVIFVGGDEGLFLLSELLRTKVKNVQILYQAVYCVWQLSYNKTVGAKMGDSNIIPRLVDLLKNMTKEKVLRLSLSTLVNLLGIGNNNEHMIDCGLMKTLDSLSTKNWGDEDIKSDLEMLRETLQKNIVILSSFDMYKKRITVRSLRMEPCSPFREILERKCSQIRGR